MNEVFCGTIADLESALQTFENIKIKTSNASKLKDAVGGVVAAVTPISNSAATPLTKQVSDLSKAVDALNSATENYATASDKTAAGKKLSKSITALHTAITTLRAAASCAT